MSYNNAAINESPTISELAGAAMTSPAMKAVKYDSSGNIVFATAGALVAGLLLPSAEDSVASGDRVDVQIKDIGLWIAGAAVAKGAELASDANGKAVTAAAGDFIAAIALEAASAAGKVIKVQIVKLGYKPADLSTLTLGDLADVDLSTAPTDNQILKYVAADNKFKPAADATA